MLLKSIKNSIDLANFFFNEAQIHNSKFFYELGKNNLRNAEILMELLT